MMVEQAGFCSGWLEHLGEHPISAVSTLRRWEFSSGAAVCSSSGLMRKARIARSETQRNFMEEEMGTTAMQGITGRKIHRVFSWQSDLNENDKDHGKKVLNI